MRTFHSIARARTPAVKERESAYYVYFFKAFNTSDLKRVLMSNAASETVMGKNVPNYSAEQ